MRCESNSEITFSLTLSAIGFDVIMPAKVVALLLVVAILVVSFGRIWKHLCDRSNFLPASNRGTDLTAINVCCQRAS